MMVIATSAIINDPSTVTVDRKKLREALGREDWETHFPDAFYECSWPKCEYKKTIAEQSVVSPHSGDCPLAEGGEKISRATGSSTCGTCHGDGWQRPDNESTAAWLRTITDDIPCPEEENE